MDTKSTSLPTKQRVWTLNQFSKGEPAPEDAVLVERPLDVDKMVRGEVLVKATYLSVDPYMRIAFDEGRGVKGAPLPGEGVGVVLKSLHENFAEGDVVVGEFAWRDYAIVHGSELKQQPKEWPASYGLGVLGMPGCTAYTGLFELAKPKPTDVIFITGAAGAVGSLVGQLAKSIGCTVIGSAGGPRKVAYCKELGFDACIDYRGKSRDEVVAELKELAPSGIDIFFDNTGGPVNEAAILSLKHYGKVIVCGQVHHYNAGVDTLTPSSINMFPMIMMKAIHVLGHHWTVFDKEWQRDRPGVWKLIQEKKIRVDETVAEGLENAYEAFRNMLKGANIGKQVIKLA